MEIEVTLYGPVKPEDSNYLPSSKQLLSCSVAEQHTATLPYKGKMQQLFTFSELPCKVKKHYVLTLQVRR